MMTEEERRERSNQRCKEYYKKHWRKIKRYRKKYYKDNKEHINKSMKQYYKINRKRILNRSLKYREVRREQLRTKGRNYYKNNKSDVKSRLVHRIYGITREEYRKILSSQNRLCAICHVRFSTKIRVQIDHDHKTGDTRGFLCSRCNTILGMANDAVETLKSAITYLVKHKKEDKCQSSDKQ